MGHYDPSVLYYIHRKGWEEDPYLWTPLDEESAIAKGARSFIAVEPKRLARNKELSNWLLRFPLENSEGAWPVYETDPAKILPGAEARWQAFRRAEKSGSWTTWRHAGRRRLEALDCAASSAGPPKAAVPFGVPFPVGPS